MLPPDVAVLHARALDAPRAGYEREGEADVVIGDPDRGILAIEVKSGEIRRDANGAGMPASRLPRSPFEQAADSRHALVRKLRELPDWPAGLEARSAVRRSRSPTSSSTRCAGGSACWVRTSTST